ARRNLVGEIINCLQYLIWYDRIIRFPVTDEVFSNFNHRRDSFYQIRCLITDNWPNINDKEKGDEQNNDEYHKNRDNTMDSKTFKKVHQRLRQIIKNPCSDNRKCYRANQFKQWHKYKVID